jgi:nucleoside-diphosphate kinase
VLLDLKTAFDGRVVLRARQSAEVAPAIIGGRMTERTLAIIKPDAVERRLSGTIIQRIEDEGFQIHAMRRVHLSKAQAEGFYAVHRERPFFASLTSFMSSGPAIVVVLAAPDAIKKWRTLMGATDPAKADPGTLRREFAQSIERNATHGSDAPDTAAYEIGYFFPGIELI